MPVTPERKAQMREVLEDALRVINALSVVTPCNECEWFDSGYCQQWQAIVPEEYRPEGCEEFKEKVPF